MMICLCRDNNNNNNNNTLFSLYINDLVDMFDSTCEPVELQNRKLYCLLYADDIVLLSDQQTVYKIVLINLNTSVRNGIYL